MDMCPVSDVQLKLIIKNMQLNSVDSIEVLSTWRNDQSISTPPCIEFPSFPGLIQTSLSKQTAITPYYK